MQVEIEYGTTQTYPITVGPYKFMDYLIGNDAQG
jgi:hypothetical protein